MSSYVMLPGLMSVGAEGSASRGARSWAGRTHARHTARQKKLVSFFIRVHSCSFVAKELLLGAGGLGFDRDLYHGVGPATLESAAAVAGPIVGHYAQDVVSGLAEGDRGSGLTVERRFAFDFLNLRPVLGKSYDAGSSIFAPRHGHRWKP